MTSDGWQTIETDSREEDSGQSDAAALLKHIDFGYRSDVGPVTHAALESL